MPRMTLAAIAVAIVAFTTQADARPKQHVYHRQHVAHPATAAQPRAILDVAALPAYSSQETRPRPLPMGRRHIATPVGPDVAHYRGRTIWDRVSIPTPAGTWRIARSCGQRLSAFWNLGPGLDATSTWPGTFARTSSPRPRVAIYTPGHIMGIVGGQEGAWRVVSFNGDGRHGNVEFTINSLHGYTLLDTTTRISSTGISAKRHHRHENRRNAYNPRHRVHYANRLR